MASAAPPAGLDPPQPVASLDALLGRLLRITIQDGRYFIGRLTCLDSTLNIVITQAEEFRAGPKSQAEVDIRLNEDLYFPKSAHGGYDGPGWAKFAKPGDGYTVEENEQEGRAGEGDRGLNGKKREGRMLGMIMIPWKWVVKVELIEEEDPAQPATPGRSPMMDLGDII